MSGRLDRSVFAAWLLACLCSCVVSGLLVHAGGPTPQLTMPCEIVRVTDGDTVVVEVRTRFSVRLLDCWAPEKHETDIKGEKARGLAAEAAMKAIAEGKAGVVTIPLPADPNASLASVFTLGRILGQVSIGDQDIAERQRKAGHAFATKDELIRSLKGQP